MQYTVLSAEPENVLSFIYRLTILFFSPLERKLEVERHE